MFYNYTNEDFQVTWDKNIYLFKAGQVYQGLAIAKDGISNVPLTDAVCETFAKHLAYKVLNAPSLNENFRINDKGEQVPLDLQQMRTYNITSVEALTQRAMNGPDTAVEIPKSLDGLPLMEGVEAPVVEAVEEPEEPVVEEPKKRGRPRKEEASPSPEAEFNV